MVIGHTPEALLYNVYVFSFGAQERDIVMTPISFIKLVVLFKNYSYTVSCRAH